MTIYHFALHPYVIFRINFVYNESSKLFKYYEDKLWNHGNEWLLQKMKNKWFLILDYSLCFPIHFAFPD